MTKYDILELVGGFIGAFGILISLGVIFIGGWLNRASFLQTLSSKCNIILAIGFTGVGIAMASIMISKFLQCTKNTFKNKKTICRGKE